MCSSPTWFIWPSSFTTSVGFMSFCWNALLTLCQSFPSLRRNNSALQRVRFCFKLRAGQAEMISGDNSWWIRGLLTEWAARTPRLLGLCMLSRVWSQASGGNCSPFCRAPPISKERQYAQTQRIPASSERSCRISYDNQPNNNKWAIKRIISR